MDIRNWPMDKIMQLPDCCFGRRWPISVGVSDVAAATHYDISEAALPERCVVWSMFFIPHTTTAAHTRVTLSLGDVLPTTDAQFDALEPVFRDLGCWDGNRRVFCVHVYVTGLILPIRQPVLSSGRKLVGRFEVAAVSPYPIVVGVIISSIPTEVPDWLCSGRV